MSREKELFDLRYHRIEAETSKAVLVRFKPREEPVWMPLSQVELDRDEKIITVPDWLADEKDLDIDDLQVI